MKDPGINRRIRRRPEIDESYVFSRRFWIALTGVLLLGACSDAEQRSFQGYVEGDYLYLAAPSAGYLASLNVERGSHVEAGGLVFSIEADPDQFELSTAEAQMFSAQEKVINLQKPRREPEIAATEAQLRTKEANLRYSEAQLKRFEILVKHGFVSDAELDQARSLRDQNAAEVEEARKQLSIFKITLGREAEIRSAEADLTAAKARMQERLWQVDKKTVLSPAQGQITETYYRPGEWIQAGQPVVSFLPDDRRRIRFYVPETEIAKIQLGREVEASCDGCRAPVRAKVTFIAPQAEYTPPVIYSRETRAKLVFRIEAMPAPGDARRLHPGLPMIVQLPDGV